MLEQYQRFIERGQSGQSCWPENYMSSNSDMINIWNIKDNPWDKASVRPRLARQHWPNPGTSITFLSQDESALQSCPIFHLSERISRDIWWRGRSRCIRTRGRMGRVSGVPVLMALNGRHLVNNAASVPQTRYVHPQNIWPFIMAVDCRQFEK